MVCLWFAMTCNECYAEAKDEYFNPPAELSAEGGMQVAKGAEAKPYVSSFTSNTVKSVTEVKSATLGGRKSLDYLGGAPKKSAGDKTPTKNEIPAKGVETTSGETSFSTPLGKKELPDISKLKSKLPGGSKLPVKSIVPPFPSTEVGDSEFKASSTSDDESEQASTSLSIASSQAQAPFKKGLPFMKKSSQIIDLKSDTESPTKKTLTFTNNKFGVVKSSGTSSIPGSKIVSPPKLTFKAKEAADNKSREGNANSSPFGKKSFGVGQQKSAGATSFPKAPSIKDIKQPKLSKSFGTQSGPTKLELPKMPMKTTFKKSLVKGAESRSKLGTTGGEKNFGSTPLMKKQVPVSSSFFPKKDTPVPKTNFNEKTKDDSTDDSDEQETVGVESTQFGQMPPNQVTKSTGGGSFKPQAFTPPQPRAVQSKSLDNDDDAIDVKSEDAEESVDDEYDDTPSVAGDPGAERPASRAASAAKQPEIGKIFSGDSFYGTTSSRVYTKVPGSMPLDKKVPLKKGNGVARTSSSSSSSKIRVEKEPRGSDADVNVDSREMKRRLDEMLAKERRQLAESQQQVEEARSREERLARENAKISAMLVEAEKKIAQLSEKMDDERRQRKVGIAKAEKKVFDLEASRTREARTFESRLEEEKAKVANLIRANKLNEEQNRRDEATKERNDARERARWKEEQSLITQRNVERQIALEREKMEENINQLKEQQANDEARKAEEQKQAIERLVAAEIEAKEKVMREKVDQEIATEREKIAADLYRMKQEQSRKDAEREEEQEKLIQERLASELARARRRLEDEQANRDAEKSREIDGYKSRWLEEQKVEMKRKIDILLAEERAIVDAEISKLKAEQEKSELERERAIAAEKSRWMEDQDRLVKGRVEQELAVEKAKIETAKFNQRSRGLRVNGDSTISPSQTPRDQGSPAEESSPDSPVQPALVDTKDQPFDALATDPSELEIVSMCTAGIGSTQDVLDQGSCVLPSDYPFVSLLRDSSPYIINHRLSTIVFHLPGDLISDAVKFNSVVDDIALTWLFGMKIVIVIGCRQQVRERLEQMHGPGDYDDGFGSRRLGVRATSEESLRIVEEEAGFCRFEVERLLNRSLRSKGADINVVSGCFVTGEKFGSVDGVDFKVADFLIFCSAFRLTEMLTCLFRTFS